MFLFAFFIGFILAIAGYLIAERHDFPGFCLFIVGLMVIFLSLVMTIKDGVHFSTGKGEHIGYISSTETTGIIFKTPRAYFKTSLQSSQEDAYCVENKELLDELNSLTNKNIIIYYRSYIVNGIKYCGGESAIITGVKVIDEAVK